MTFILSFKRISTVQRSLDLLRISSLDSTRHHHSAKSPLYPPSDTIVKCRNSVFICIAHNNGDASKYCIQGNFRPRFIFAHFAHRLEGEFKTGLIESYIKDCIRKYESGRIQDWANQSRISRGRK